MEEIWKPIREFEGIYEISNLGNVKRLQYFHNMGGANIGYLCREHNISPEPTPKGYLRIRLSNHAKPKRTFLHRLLAETFIPNPENKLQVNHIDGDKLNNKIENLEWCTPSQNGLHRSRVLRKVVGESHGMSKLKKSEVAEIRDKYKPFVYSLNMLAREYNVSKKAILLIIQNRNWKNVE